MLRARLGGNRGNIGNSEMQPEVNSNYNSVSDYADLAVSVASCESGVSATAGKLPIYLVEMMVPKNQIVSLGGTLEYPAGSYWASHHAAGSNAVSVYRFDPSSGSLQSTNTYRANGATEAFLFGEVSASRIRSITPIAEGEYTFELHER
jgi:hypothetical protein